jgi:hypothetical protein
MGRCPVGRDPGQGSLGGGRQKGGLKEALSAEIQKEIEHLIGDKAADSLDFEAVEMAARRHALRIAATILEHHLNTDHSDYCGPQQPCACGQSARFAGRRTKRFTSVLGPLQLERAYYHCAHCGGGYCPRDEALGLVGSVLSPGVVRMVGLVGARVSFEEGDALLRGLAGVEVGSKQVERSAKELGDAIDRDERHHVVLPERQQIAPTMYLGVDGTGIPMRPEEVEGRAGKQPDGSAKTREGKLCVVWSAEGRDADGKPVRDHGSVSYSAAIESAASTDADFTASEFAQRVLRETERRGFMHAKRRCILGDGAGWIWKTATDFFPDAIQILDRFHAKEHLRTVATEIWGTNSELGKQWAAERHAELDAGNTDAILQALQAHASTCSEARKCIGYVARNRERMRYPEFEAQGLCTSTGVVESGCNVAIGHRLKRSAMHWGVRGANAIIALRCNQLSGRFEDFWERRTEGRQAA